MSYGSGVSGEFLVCLDFWTRCYFAEEPVGEGGFLGDLARGFHSCYERGGIVALWVGEVAEIEGGLDGGIGGGEVDSSSASGTGDVGGHAEGV